MTRESPITEPELPIALAQQALRFAASLDLKEVRYFAIENIPFSFRPVPSVNPRTQLPNEAPAEFHYNYAHGMGWMWTIYIWEDLPEKVQRVLLLHEIIEVLFIKQHQLGSPQAHQATLPYEAEFIHLLDLTEDERKILEDLRKQYSKNN